MRLLELAQERNRFLRHMSHELKTPLANIREGTELLMDGAVGELDSAQREVATILRDNGIKLQQLIENLLSFSAWQARHSGLEISEFRLRPLVKSALETHQLTLLAQRVHLDLKVQDIELRADRAKLKLIMDNLLSNALKYSPRGGTIFIHAHADKEVLVLDVADTGPGISKEERGADLRRVLLGPRADGRAPEGHRHRPVGGARSSCRRTAARSKSWTASFPERISASACRSRPARSGARLSGPHDPQQPQIGPLHIDQARAHCSLLDARIGPSLLRGTRRLRTRRRRAAEPRADAIVPPADQRRLALPRHDERPARAPTRPARPMSSTKSNATTRARRPPRARCVMRWRS